MKRVLLYTTLLLLLISCGKNTEAAKLLPAISTTSVSGINATEATCGGNITAEGSANDVYVAGKTNSNVPCYWLNGQKTSLSASTDWHNKATGIVYR